MQTSSSTPNAHLAAADVLRGVAVLLVVVYHACGPTMGWALPWNGWWRDFSAPPSPLFYWFYPCTLGWAGVPLFFVLSGFCIHYSFLRSKDSTLSRFFWRRFWRIYPAYLVALLALTALARVPVFSAAGARQVGAHALLIHNLFDGTFFGINPSFWSIATEVQLYLLYPLLLWLRSRLQIGGCVLLTLAVGMVWRVVAALCWGFPDHTINAELTCPLMTWFDWTLGAFVAERFAQGKPAFGRPGLLVVLVPLFLVSTLYRPLLNVSFVLAAATGAVLLDSGLWTPWSSSWWVTALKFLGLVSYSLYLWHQPLLLRVVYYVKLFTGSLTAAWCVVPLVLLGVSWLSYTFIEQFGIKAGERLWPRAKPSSLVAATARMSRP